MYQRNKLRTDLRVSEQSEAVIVPEYLASLVCSSSNFEETAELCGHL